MPHVMMFLTIFLIVSSLSFYNNNNVHAHSLISSSSSPSSLLKPATTTTTTTLKPLSTNNNNNNWKDAKQALQRPDCCVVSVDGLEPQLKVLQKRLVHDNDGIVVVAADIDLRAKIRTGNEATCHEDCQQVWNSIVAVVLEESSHDGSSKTITNHNDDLVATSINALMELSKGMARMMDPLQNKENNDVYCRIVSASQYKALSPPYHTDKAPLRGYVTLCGVGTEFMTRPCHSIWEYVSLRTIGEGSTFIRQAKELEFIVMKGDYYYDYDANNSIAPKSAFWKNTRAHACVHRSPPGGNGSAKRVIISFDLQDGKDDREWCDVNQKRQWRAGMTQRKSRLVA